MDDNEYNNSDYSQNLHKDAKGSTFENARLLRQFQTFAEKRLWQALRNRKFLDLKFRRQHPFGNYVLDFYCHECKLCIEADGAIHLEKDVIEYDEARTKFLNENNITVLRFTNDEIIYKLDAVKEKLKTIIKGNES